MTLIGIGGRLASGKDSIADYLSDAHGWQKMGMSDPLHQSMMTLNPIVNMTHHHLVEELTTVRYAELTVQEGYTLAKENFEYRRLLQVFGTEVIRELFGNSVWVDFARKRVLECIGKQENVILTDLRYPNEIDLVRELGGSAWWVDRPGFNTAGEHTSENSVNEDDFDVTISNSGTLEDLHDTVYQELFGTTDTAEED